jgi:hypothetical protein
MKRVSAFRALGILCAAGLAGAGNAAVPVEAYGNIEAVRLAQLQMMANALKAAGVRHQLITLDSEDHWLSSSATRIRMLTEIEKFLAANLGAKPTN